MSYKKEFPSFKLDIKIPEGFDDASWHNDACPSWFKPAIIDGDEGLTLWVDYQKQSESDFYDVDAKDWKRFKLSNTNHNEGTNVMLIESNNYQEILDFIEQYIKEG